MKRRNILKFLSALPFLGFLVKAEEDRSHWKALADSMRETKRMEHEKHQILLKSFIYQEPNQELLFSQVDNPDTWEPILDGSHPGDHSLDPRDWEIAVDDEINLS